MASARANPVTYREHGEWYDGEIRRFVRLDNADPPPAGGILFVGSSIFREWREIRDFDADFAPLPVLNRAFGGSQTDDQLRVMDAIVFPHRPKVLVYYCGSNDLNWGTPPEAIVANFAEWSRRVVDALGPDVRILFVAVNRAPQKAPVWNQLDRTNQLAAAYCAATPNHAFVDVNADLFEDAERRRPKTALYRDDGLHFEPAGYDAFLPTVRRAVEAAWGEAVGAGEVAGGGDDFLPPGMRR